MYTRPSYPRPMPPLLTAGALFSHTAKLEMTCDQWSKKTQKEDRVEQVGPIKVNN